MSDETRAREPASAPRAHVKTQMATWRAKVFATAPPVPRDASPRRDAEGLFVDRHGRDPSELRRHAERAVGYAVQVDAMLQSLENEELVTGREMSATTLFNKLLFARKRFELLAARDAEWAAALEALREWDVTRHAS